MNPLHWLADAGVAVAIRVARSMPLATTQRLTAALARRVFDRGGRRVELALENLRIAYPEKSEEQRRAIGRESYAHLVWSQLDWARSTGWSQDEILSRVEFNGLEHARDALARGRGGFLLTLHMGSFEVASKAVPLAGLPLSVLGRPIDNARLYQRIVAERTRTGAGYIDRRGGARPMLRALRSKQLVGVLNDQYARGAQGGVWVPLFGARCSTSSGVATLALRADAPVIPFYTYRDGPDHHQLVFEPPVVTPRSDDRRADIEAATAAYNQVLERIIRSHPEQWIWAHRRFRRSPDLPELAY